MTSRTEPGPASALKSNEGGIPAAAVRLSALVSAAPGRPTQPSHAPFDGSLLGGVPVCTTDDVDAAVVSARTAQRMWAAVPLTERRAVIRRFRGLLLQRETEVLDMVQAESGKSRLSAFEELADVALTASYYGRTAARYLRPARRRGAAPLLASTVEYRLPKGVVGIISPWNYPLTLAVSDALPALLAGNARARSS